MSTQYLSQLKDQISNCARQHYLQLRWRRSLNVTELSTLFTALENNAEEKYNHVRRIKVGHKVTLFDVQTKEIITLILVNPRNSSPENGRISCLSPLGKQLIGCMPGDVVEIKIFYRTEIFRVVRIEH